MLLEICTTCCWHNKRRGPSDRGGDGDGVSVHREFPNQNSDLLRCVNLESMVRISFKVFFLLTQLSARGGGLLDLHDHEAPERSVVRIRDYHVANLMKLKSEGMSPSYGYIWGLCC
jgi:hypothetical protein